MKNNLLKIIAASLVAMMPLSNAHAEHSEKTATEITYTTGDSIIKFRPFDYTYTSPNDNQRTDVVVGRKFNNLNLSSYWKFDNKGQSWAGPCAEYKGKALKDKLNWSLQAMYFFGLNEKTKKEGYIFPSISYSFKNFSLGLMSYAKKVEGKEAYVYFGPTLTFKITDNINSMLFESADLLGKGNLFYWKTNINLKQ